MASSACLCITAFERAYPSARDPFTRRESAHRQHPLWRDTLFHPEEVARIVLALERHQSRVDMRRVTCSPWLKPWAAQATLAAAATFAPDEPARPDGYARPRVRRSS
jgi:hypothetical protein